MERIKNLKNQIKKTLEDYPETRNSDVALMIRIWQTFYNASDSIELTRLYELPREDSIKRLRAHFSAMGRFWPTDLRVAIARRINEDEWRKEMGYPPKADPGPPKQPKLID